MKPKSSKYLVPAALVGAAATGFLVVMLLGGDGRAARRGGQQEATHSSRSGGVPGQPGTVRKGGAEPSRVGNSRVLPGQRQPHDGPQTLQDRIVAQDRVIELLQQIMLAENINKRFAVERELKSLLRRIGHYIDPALRQRLIAMIDTVDPQWRRLVGSALGSLQGDEVVADALLEKLKNRPESRRTRIAIYEALGNLHVKKILPELVGMLGDGHDDEPMLVRTIGQIGGPKEARLLLARLEGPLRADTRNQIVRVLKEKRGMPGLMDDVATKLQDAPAQTRRSLLTVLGSSRDPEHAAAVRQLLEKETDEQVRRTAISALGNFGDPESGKMLRNLLERGDARERKYATQAISRIRNSETIAAMAEDWNGLPNDGKWALIQAGSIVAQPGEKLFQIAAEEGIRDAQMRLRVASAKMLGRPGKDDHIEPLIDFLGRAKHPSEWTQGLQALERIGTKNAAEQALSALHVVHNKQSREQWIRRFEKVMDKHRRSDALAEQAGTRLPR